MKTQTLTPKKKVFYVRMEALGYYDVKVLATTKKEAAKLADKHMHLINCHCDGFEAGEVSTEPIAGIVSDDMPTEYYPVLVEQ